MHKRSMELGGITNLAVIAPIRNDMVLGFEPISHLERLGKVLDALQSARLNVRESELRPPFFPDTIGRFGIIETFRYALVPPAPEQAQQPPDGTWRLSLNVTFDGGWEPYMRVIYRDLGPLLDLLFCHSPGYPNSRRSRFEDYGRWVRRNELGGGTFYADSPATLQDLHYLAEVERTVRDGGASEEAIARVALPSAPQRARDAMARAMADPASALVLPLRTLKGLYRLSVYFPGSGVLGSGDDMDILRSFARSVLAEAMAIMRALAALPADHPGAAQWARTSQLFADELAWLQFDAPAVPADPPRSTLPVDQLQSHVLGSGEGMTHGALVMLRVTNADLARKHIATLAVLCGPVPPLAQGTLIAFTFDGLKALGIPTAHLDLLPQEFADGMEARCGLLGDVRRNHPDFWRRPLAEGQPPDGQRIDLRTVHVVLHLRLKDDTDPGHELHATLRRTIAELQRDESSNGLHVLAVQPLRSYRDEQGRGIGHFDFVDGISQPCFPGAPNPAPVAPRDLVRSGELLVGADNDRGDATHPALDELQVNGTFLVVRKLRQRVDHLDAALLNVPEPERTDLLERMMGRRQDGSTLSPLPADAQGPNDFDYATAAASDACPHHAHVRRTNPRDGRAYLPRILRRGMSYGPRSSADRSSERGVVFMAYCASIAEQFEVIQRWVAGGNSSGVGSAQADPFLRVPQAGETHTFRYLDRNGRVARAQFDDKPLVELEWGLYLFVPSLTTLGRLDELQAPPPPAKPEPQPDPPAEEADRERMRQLLDDPDRARDTWQRVRNGDPTLQGTAYGRLLGRTDEVLAALRDDGQRCSVAGYGERMTASVGLNLLGLDGTGHNAQKGLNEAILAIDEPEAFARAAPIVDAVLARFPNLPRLNPGDPLRRPIDVLNFSDQVMARLCRFWIGLPDADDRFIATGGRLPGNDGTPRCPGNFATASRYIFSPHPRSGVADAGQAQGRAVREAVRAWLGQSPAPTLGPLAAKIQAKLGLGTTDPVFADNLAGVLLGFPPTVQGNFVRTMETWIRDAKLWERQQDLFDEMARDAPDFECATKALRAPLLETMRERPVPEMLWRSPVDAKVGVDLDPNHRIVLGIASALAEKDDKNQPVAPDDLMFGRDAPDEYNTTVHGCPGYAMAMGVMLAMFAGLLKAGTLRPTGSTVLLILTPSTPAAPPAPSPAAAASPAPGATASAAP